MKFSQERKVRSLAKKTLGSTRVGRAMRLEVGVWRRGAVDMLVDWGVVLCCREGRDLELGVGLAGVSRWFGGMWWESWLKERGQLVGWGCCYLPLIGCPQLSLDRRNAA